MGIKKVKYREKQKESNKKFMFSYEIKKEIAILKNIQRRNLRKCFECLNAIEAREVINGNKEG